ncbi:MAG: ABC transporter permease [Pseudomonadota bacterium]|nr:ABC transporter permease [Pseudomonadota bacterium]
MNSKSATDPASSVSPSRWKWWLGAFSRHRLARIGFVGLVSITVLSLIGPVLSGADIQQVHLGRMYEAPSFAHPLGTDQLGRDLLWRVMEGGRISLWIGLVATLLATVVGCGYGMVSALSEDWLDRFLMQILDAALAIPILLLVIVFQAFGDSSIFKLIFTIGFASWMGTARMMRTECRRLLQAAFIQSAIAAGTSPLRIALKHLLPNVLGPLMVVMTVGIGQAILLETTLSFLNLGVPSTLPSLGNLLGNGMSAVLGGAWWAVVFPGLAIVATVLCINLVGDGLRDIVNPRQRDHG